ncbi:hypothetical protein JCM19000A_22260 [Silvimonas sp. JCM 19000]
MKFRPRLALVSALSLLSSVAMAQVQPVTAHDYITFTLSGDATFVGAPYIWNMYANAGGYSLAPSDSLNWSIGSRDSTASLVTSGTSTTFSFQLDASSLWAGYFITPSITRAIAVGAGGGTLTISYDVFTDIPASQADLDFGFYGQLYENGVDLGVGNNHYAAGALADPAIGQSAQDSNTVSFALSAANPNSAISIDLSLLNNGAAAAPVPEPETWALMGMGMVGVLAAARRRRAVARQAA